MRSPEEFWSGDPRRGTNPRFVRAGGRLVNPSPNQYPGEPPFYLVVEEKRGSRTGFAVGISSLAAIFATVGVAAPLTLIGGIVALVLGLRGSTTEAGARRRDWVVIAIGALAIVASIGAIVAWVALLQTHWSGPDVNNLHRAFFDPSRSSSPLHGS